MKREEIATLLSIGPYVTALPVVHGSGDFAWEVRRAMLQGQWDCLAVPLPESFREPVLQAIQSLPQPSIVTSIEPGLGLGGWSNEIPPSDSQWPHNSLPAEPQPQVSYVPIDPCQAVIAALRIANEERIPIKFIDLETDPFLPQQRLLPDPYALKKVPLPQFAAAMVPFLPQPDHPQWIARVQAMAYQLRELSVDYRQILFVVNVLDWPWIRRAFFDRNLSMPTGAGGQKPEIHSLSDSSLYFMFGELPFITELYEQARVDLEDDSRLSIDGIKLLLLEARQRYLDDYRKRARKITPRMLSQCLQYTRNLTLLDGSFRPQLITLVTAAKQIAGDGFAIHVLETAKQYERNISTPKLQAQLGLQQIRLPDRSVYPAVSRLPGPPLVWSRCELIPRPDKQDQKKWSQRWNPMQQCSWPPEDEVIENFRSTVFDRAREAMGADLAKTEKFSTSIKDGIDMRDTLRNWHSGEIYVKVLPPIKQGRLDTAVMLFDSPADPRDYPWRTTWFAEHQNESTLAFFASDFAKEPVGPGICLANYGGVMFIFPPRPIPDIWNDPRLNFAETLEERLLGAACLHSECRHIALVSPGPPGLAWRQLAKHFGKTWVHLPLHRFSDAMIQQLRMVHVLNGKQVRSYAAQFIRKA